MNNNINIGTISILSSIPIANIAIGISIVNTTIPISIFRALFLSIFQFLFIVIDHMYCIKFITFELIILYMLVPYSPCIDEKNTVRSSGMDVATPATLPTAFGLKSSISAIFLNSFTNICFDINTIANEQIINFSTSNINSILSPFQLLPFFLLFKLFLF